MKTLCTLTLCVVSVSLRAHAVPELMQFPSDAQIVKGPAQITGNIDECNVGILLREGDYLTISDEWREAALYRPSGAFSPNAAPYLYKPDVEHYSDIMWTYRKPRPNGEPWLGMKCVGTRGVGFASSYISENCPAEKGDGHWKIVKSYKKSAPNAEIIEIEGKEWTGFVIFNRAKQSHQLLPVVSCMMSERHALMMQGEIEIVDGKIHPSVKATLESFQFLGERK